MHVFVRDNQCIIIIIIIIIIMFHLNDFLFRCTYLAWHLVRNFACLVPSLPT